MDLWGSCRVGDSERVKFLLSNEHADFDPNDVNDAGKTPLILAAEGDHACCVKLLLDDPRVNPNLACFGRSALIVTAGGDFVRTMEVLLSDPRVDPNQGDVKNGVPLHVSSVLNYPAGVTLLLRHPRIQPNQSVGGATAILEASAANSADTLRLLLADERVEIGTALLEATVATQAAVGRISAASPADHLTPSHCGRSHHLAHSLVVLLASRRVDPLRIAADLASMQTWMPSKRELRMSDTTPLSPRQTTARMLVPVLEAQLRGERRWCAHCLKLTPDVDLHRCGGCKQVGYCDKALPGQKPCHAAHWKAGHKKECKRFAAEAKAAAEAAAEAAGAAGGGGGGGGKKKGKKGRKKRG